MEDLRQAALRPRPHPAADPASGFRLVRYFTATSLVAFLVVAAVLSWLEWRESTSFRRVQQEQSAFVNDLQKEFGRHETSQARLDLVLMHEAEHVNLTRLLANALWDSHVAPLVRRTDRIRIAHCHALDAESGNARAHEKRACFAQIGATIHAMPELRALDAKINETMSGTSVFKVKVFDVRGLTIYSSEHAQIGEDKQSNEGWWIAADGLPASELTHRDTFSAFEGMVENRDLISSYVPVLAADGATVLAVFEIYSDVTSFLARIRSAAEHFSRTAALNQAKLAEVSARNQRHVDLSAYVVVGSVAGLLTLLYLALLLLVRRAQRLIDAQAREREQSIRREERWHREKMSVLATMAATVGHEIGNPLATITVVAEDMAERKALLGCTECQPALILDQSRRIAAKTRQMQDFAAARGEHAGPVDVNDAVRAVCEFMSFDRRFGATSIAFRGDPALPACTLPADHLTEVLMDLLQRRVEGCATPPQRIVVETAADVDRIAIRIKCDETQAPCAETAGDDLEATRRRVIAMGGRLTASDAAYEIALPVRRLAPV